MSRVWALLFFVAATFAAVPEARAGEAARSIRDAFEVASRGVSIGTRSRNKSRAG